MRRPGRGKFDHFVIVDNPLLVVQDGDRFRFLYTGEPEEELADDLVYEGVIQTVEGSDHFEALAGICGGDYQAEELVRLRRIETTETVGASMPTLSSSPMTFRCSGGASSDFETCKWAYTRVSTERPDVPKCERRGIRPTK